LPKADPWFKSNLSPVEGAGKLSYCYQCSACVAECPAAHKFKDFNPREIVLASLIGVAGYLTAKDSVIWQCTTCYKCYERCPQGTHPVEVINALKNIACAAGDGPEEVTSSRDGVLSQGTLISPSGSMEKRRRELGLGRPPFAPAGELKKILE
jgi:heterodisulfide reductase subunit C